MKQNKTGYFMPPLELSLLQFITSIWEQSDFVDPVVHIVVIGCCEWGWRVIGEQQENGLGALDQWGSYWLRKRRMIWLNIMGRKKRATGNDETLWCSLEGDERNLEKQLRVFSTRKAEDHMLRITLLDLFQLFLISIVCKWNKALHYLSE